jgi:hypothetical protein
MILIPWLVDNSSWLIPAAGWLVSEIQGWRSGSSSASVSQVVWDAIKEILLLLKDKFNAKN